MTQGDDPEEARPTTPPPGLGAPAPGGEVPPLVEAPWWNVANLFTLLRVALVPVIAVLLFVGGTPARWWAFGIFLFAALTDSIDGWVARRFVGVTRWGQVADPAADKLLIIGSLIILASIGPTDLPWWAVIVIIVREAGVTALRHVLLRRGVVMAAFLSGKIKTVTQVIAVTWYLLPGADPGLRLVALWIAVIATVASGVEYVVRGRRLVRSTTG